MPMPVSSVQFGTRTSYPNNSGYITAAADINLDGRMDLVGGTTILLGNGDGTFQGAIATGAGGSTVAVGDLNRDGRPDLIVGGSIGYNAFQVLLGNGDGTFTGFNSYATGAAQPNGVPRAVAVADLTGDGVLDVVVANSSTYNRISYTPGTFSILAGNGDGTFQPPTLIAASGVPVSVAISDINNDGREDLLLGNLGTREVQVMLGNGDGTFVAASNTGSDGTPFSISVGDLNGDGNIDIAVVNGFANFRGEAALDTISVRLGNGDGTFQAQATYTVGSPPTQIAMADLNRDGYLDLVVDNENLQITSVLVGTGTGAFRPAVTYSTSDDLTSDAPHILVVADYNNDGRPDIATGGIVLINTTPVAVSASLDFNGDDISDLLWRNASTGQISFWMSNGVGGYSYQLINQGDLSWQLQDTADFNGDGVSDLLWRNTGTGQLGFWNGDGAGGFSYQTINQGDLNWQIQDTGDFNGDGISDLLWRNAVSGQLGLWNGDGTGGFSYRTFDQGDPTWQIVGTGDFNGDGRDDILWNSTASWQAGVWYSTGSGFTYQVFNQGDPTSPWRIQGTGDFNADGIADILWRNGSNGQVGLWNSNGAGGFGYQIAELGDQSWQIRGTGDYNGDDISDILWRNTASGQLGIWHSNGAGGFSYRAIDQGDLAWNTYNGNDTLVASASNTTLFGNPGTTTFVIGPGAGIDTIRNFETSQDTLQFNPALFANYSAAMSHASQVGANTVFSIDANNSVTLANIDRNTLTAGNFRFS